MSPHVNANTRMQDFCTLALENIKVYQPEIVRLDGRADALAKEVQDLEAATRQQLGRQHETDELLSRRCSTLEERIVKLEALVAVLPTWREDLVRGCTGPGLPTKLRSHIVMVAVHTYLACRRPVSMGWRVRCASRMNSWRSVLSSWMTRKDIKPRWVAQAAMCSYGLGTLYLHMLVL